MKGAGEISTVQPPWVAEDEWFDAVTATPDTIRAALSAGDGACVQKRSSAITLVNSHDRHMRALRTKRGWVVFIGNIGSAGSLRGVHKGARLEGRRVRLSWFDVLFNRVGESFTSEETEQLMIEFLDRPGNPPSADWIDLECR